MTHHLIVERYFIIYKPYNMISQFVSPYEQTLLGDLNFPFPEGTQAVGRLDEESEGLLILTTDKTLTRKLLHPSKKHSRKYIVQVRRHVTDETLEQLSSGIEIIIKKRGAYQTMPCRVSRIEKPDHLASRSNTLHESVHQSWLEFELTEGKNRQIRKMCKAVKHNCYRLIRTHIGSLSIGNMQPGEVREIDKETLFELLELD